MTELFDLAFKYGSLAVDCIATLFKAHSEQLTEEQIQTEIARIKQREHDQMAEDWKVVNS